MYGSGKYSRKRVIFTLVYMASIGIPFVAFMYHLANPNIPLFLPSQITMFISALLALGSGVFTVDKRDKVKVTVFGIELAILIAFIMNLGIEEPVTILALFIGAYWGAIKYLSMDFFETNRTEEQPNDKKPS